MTKSVFTKNYKKFCEILIAERKKRGITQAVLAEKLNYPQSFVSKYENGERRLDIVEFIIISQTIGADPHEILTKTENLLTSNEYQKP